MVVAGTVAVTLSDWRVTGLRPTSATVDMAVGPPVTALVLVVAVVRPRGLNHAIRTSRNVTVTPRSLGRSS